MTAASFNFINFRSFAGAVALVLVFCAHYLVLEAIFLYYARRSTNRLQLKRRLATEGSDQEQQRALARIRQRGGLSASGQHFLPVAWLDRLIVQSGVTWGVAAFPAIFMSVSAVVSLPVLFVGGNLVTAVVAGLLGGAGVVVFFLTSMRNRRHRKLQGQLAEATDILVRSLRAGHPVASAIRLVSQEIADPLGTEFAVVADEMTYGLDLDTAMNNLASRVGQKDLALIVVATSLQTSTGGNLAEILSSMARVLRESVKLRMKVRALSAEGRWSAIILSILPFALFAILQVIAPRLYGEVWGEPMVTVVLVAATLWVVLGNVIMLRMTRFEI
jgi:tight adherence protein B